MEKPESTGPQWTQEEAISYECARECITDLVGIYSGAIWDEEHQPSPSQKKIQSLLDARRALVNERMKLQVEDHEHIAKIRSEYGAIIRTHRAQPRQEAA